VNCAKGYKDYSSKLSLIPNIEKCPQCRSIENFYWACETVISRGYHLKKSDYMKLSIGEEINVHEDAIGLALYPGIDIFNHEPVPHIKRKTLRTHGISFNYKTAEIVVRADRDTKRGNEVYISYGSKNNIACYFHMDLYCKIILMISSELAFCLKKMIALIIILIINCAFFR
jgi:hypothetical protein